MRISEIFHSIQGEGIHTNSTMNFIRLQGCNLYQNPAGCCLYCDTRKSQNPNNGGYELSVRGVLERVIEVRKGFCNWYCITGGEPLLQVQELGELVRAIRNVHDYHQSSNLIEIETNGTLPPPSWFDIVDSWVVDIKTLSAGYHLLEQTQFPQWKHLLRSCDQVKFVVGIKEDLEFTREMVEDFRTLPFNILVSPVVDSFGTIQHMITPGFMSEVIDFVLKYNLRLSVQVHKFIGVR